MMQNETGRRALATGLCALMICGAIGAGDALAAPRKKEKDRMPTRAELDAEVEPGRLIFDNSVRRRRLSFESIIKQSMDNRYSQPMVEEIAKQFWAKKYKPVTLVLDPNQRPVVVELDEIRGMGDVGPGRPRQPGQIDVSMQPGTGTGDGDGPGTGIAPPPTTLPTTPGTGPGDGPGTGIAPPTGPAPDIGPMARDLENGIHNAVLASLKGKGYNLVALNVFAQTLDLVKVILIIATKDLPDQRIRPTLRDVRQVIEREVLAAKYPGVHLAELSSFTLLNERDSHFYEHPVLYWQLGKQRSGGGPIVPGRLPGEGPGVGSVATGPVDDYFTSAEFEPEEDFDERDLIGGF